VGYFAIQVAMCLRQAPLALRHTPVEKAPEIEAIAGAALIAPAAMVCVVFWQTSSE